MLEKEKKSEVLMDANGDCIITVSTKGFNVIITENTEDNIKIIINKIVNFINLNYKNQTIGLSQDKKMKITLNEFKNIKVIELT